MKKFIFSIMTFAAVTTASAQKFSYKVGLMTGVPAITGSTSISTGSVILQANTKLSKKTMATLDAGYVRIKNDENNISQLPVMLGAKYIINDTWSFGASAGVTIPTKKAYGNTEFGYSPYVEYTNKKISVDARYYLSGIQTPIRTLALVFSYSL